VILVFEAIDKAEKKLYNVNWCNAVYSKSVSCPLLEQAYNLYSLFNINFNVYI